MYVSAPAAVWVETSAIAAATVAARVASRATIAVAFKNPSATPSVPRRRWPDAETNGLRAHTKIEMRRRRGKPVSCRPTRSRRSLTTASAAATNPAGGSPVFRLPRGGGWILTAELRRATALGEPVPARPRWAAPVLFPRPASPVRRRPPALHLLLRVNGDRARPSRGSRLGCLPTLPLGSHLPPQPAPMRGFRLRGPFVCFPGDHKFRPRILAGRPARSPHLLPL